MQPLVSIITPCYNSEKYINRYLDCILKQTYSNIQLIIINDGSSDSTEKIVAEKESELKEKPEMLVDYLVRRTGIIREMSIGTIDFVHKEKA